MSKKKTKIIPLLAIITASVIILTIFLPTVSGVLGRNNNNKSLLPQENQPSEPLENLTKNPADYYTTSGGGNIEIGVLFKNPIMDNHDDLLFDIVLNTHSIDLSKYKALDSFLELRTENNVTITDGFIWEAEVEDTHHIRGVLKVKNSYNDEPIYTENTNYLNLVFRDIGGINEREHIYKDATLN